MRNNKSTHLIQRDGYMIGSLLTLAMVLMILLLPAQEQLTVGEPELYDSQVHVITNRQLISSGGEFLEFGEQLESSGNLHFLRSYYQDGNWTFTLQESLTGMTADQASSGDWLIFVHGDGKTLLSAVDRAREIQELYQLNVIVFSWPSKDQDLGAIKNFKTSYANIEQSAGSFYHMLDLFRQMKVTGEWPSRSGNLSLFLHSLGNYYLVRLFEEGLLDELNSVIFDNLIINAAAVEAKDHHHWIEGIEFASRIYVNSNDDDMSLSGLRVLTRLGRQLGESPLDALAVNARYVDFTSAVGFSGMGPSHSYYFSPNVSKSQNIRSYYRTIFHGYEASLDNSEQFASLQEQQTFTIIF